MKKKGFSAWQKFFIGLAVVLCVIFVAAMGVFAYYKYIHNPISGINDDTVSDFGKIMTDENGNIIIVDENNNILSMSEKEYNFLVIGCDRGEWLTDVIMIVNYDVKNNSLAIMQIPRDTYVTVSSTLILDNGKISAENFLPKNGYGCKINSAFSHGAKLALTELNNLTSSAGGESDDKKIAELCSQSVLDIDAATLKSYMNAKSSSEKNDIANDIRFNFAVKYLRALISRSFGTPIDFYAQVNLDGFVNIVDAVGGVDVYVQQNMDYDDPYQNLHIHIKQGQQHLNGKDAEGFIRFRYGYAAADIARIDAQKIFMTEFIKKVVSLEGIKNINTLIKEINNNLKTDISLSNAMYFATNALDIDFSKIVMLTMPGSPLYKDGVSYYSVDKKTLIEYVNTYLNKFNEPLEEENFLAYEIGSGNIVTAPLTAEEISQNQPKLGFISRSSGGGSSSPSKSNGGSVSGGGSDTANQPTPSDGEKADGSEPDAEITDDNAPDSEISDNYVLIPEISGANEPDAEISGGSESGGGYYEQPYYDTNGEDVPFGDEGGEGTIYAPTPVYEYEPDSVYQAEEAEEAA